MPLTKKEKDALKFLGAHLFYGTAAAATFWGMLLITNLSNIRNLAIESPHPVLVLGILFFGLFVTFGSLSMAVGVMSLGEEDEPRD